jgi:hypothetical protein
MAHSGLLNRSPSAYKPLCTLHLSASVYIASTFRQSIGGEIGDKLDRESSTLSPLAKRIGYLKRLFARGIGRTPTAKQKLALERAARLTAAAELAAANPLTTANDLVRLDGAAARARRDLQYLIDRRAPETEMTLQRYAAMHASRKAAS